MLLLLAPAKLHTSYLIKVHLQTLKLWKLTKSATMMIEVVGTKFTIKCHKSETNFTKIGDLTFALLSGKVFDAIELSFKTINEFFPLSLLFLDQSSIRTMRPSSNRTMILCLR
ncbi:hypothetical protein KQX54_008908 [Cotesia glomerata]|uniref:Uncharacterized protein n=1 Tax=Cotesia glomerata TaxID=32391 RepID=A0AAV7IKV8_COTGL|nr:hypothetical protein KQX54_008908 [Cotesia glomerata]